MSKYSGVTITREKQPGIKFRNKGEVPIPFYSMSKFEDKLYLGKGM